MSSIVAVGSYRNIAATAARNSAAPSLSTMSCLLVGRREYPQQRLRHQHERQKHSSFPRREFQRKLLNNNQQERQTHSSFPRREFQRRLKLQQQQQQQQQTLSSTSAENNNGINLNNNNQRPSAVMGLSFGYHELQRGLRLQQQQKQRAFSTTTVTANDNDEFQSLNSDKRMSEYNVCFLRHGQSTWNRDNIFIGWTDTPLTDEGVEEAKIAGKLLKESGMKFDEVHTSLLRRCIRTTDVVLKELHQEYIPVNKNWRLNERNYGELVGKDKKEIVATHGVDQVKRWRRSYDEPPPEMSDEHKYNPANDPRYRMMTDKIPKSESLQDTKERSKVYWDKVIAPQLRSGKTLLIVGHENNLRSLIMRLEGIPKEDVINLCLPRAVPLAYRLDENLKPLDRPDGKLDEATGFLRGEWLGGDESVAETLKQDRKQVYDTSTTNTSSDECSEDNTETPDDHWVAWMNPFLNGGRRMNE